MSKPTLEMARTVAQSAPPNISFEDATKLCASKYPRMNSFDLSVLAGWVERFKKTTSN